MMDFITEEHREEYFRKLYIDVNKFHSQRVNFTFIFGFLGLFIAIALMVVLKFSIATVLLGILVVALMSYMGWKYMYLTLSSELKRQDARLGLVFPEFLQVFISLLHVNPGANVVTLMEGTIPYLEEPIKTQVIRLTKRIYEDASADNIRDSFNEFASYIGTSESKRTLDMVYEMYMEGVNERTLSELDSKIQAMNENSVTSYVEAKSKKIQNKSMVCIIAMCLYIFGFAGVVAVAYGGSALSKLSF